MRLSALEAADEVQRRVLWKVENAASRVDTVLNDTVNIRTEVTRLVNQASVAANDAKEAAADIGSNELSAMYERYAKSHLRRAMWFRAWTIGLLGAGVAVAAALVLGIDFSGWLPIHTHAPTSEWTPVAYRLAVVAGLAALAAYLGRQAGNHRRLGEWASAIEIQLRAFNAFIAKIADPKVRDEAQLAFARRVLGPAPDASRVVESGSMLQPVVDAFVRRTG